MVYFMQSTTQVPFMIFLTITWSFFPDYTIYFSYFIGTIGVYGDLHDLSNRVIAITMYSA